jgi:signal transduction histidine kinase
METGQAGPDTGLADRQDGDNMGPSWDGGSPLAIAPALDRGGSSQALSDAGQGRALLDALAVGLALVLAFGFVDPVTYRAPTLRAAMESVMTLFALAAAAVLREQFHYAHRLRKLLLLGAVLILALTELLASALPSALHFRAGSALAAAYPVGQLIAAAVLVAAARTPSDKVVFRIRRPGFVAALMAVGAVAVAELVGWLLRGELVIHSTPESALRQVLHHPLALTMLILTASLFLWAAAEFFRDSRVEQSRVMQLLGAGALCLAAARLYYLMIGSVTPETVSLRDVLRLVGFGCILGAALRQDWVIRTRATQAAAVAERQRVARDLHDGLAQDLAFIAAHGERMSEDLGEEHPVTRAARHALAISREAISSLSDASSSTAREAMEAIAHELSERFEMQVVADVSCDAPLTADSRNEVGRIMREAIANAARHGGAKHVLVTLKRNDAGLVLRVIDDGRGIHQHMEPAREGFGIQSMRERAAGLGGTLRVRNGRSCGTELEVTLP